MYLVAILLLTLVFAYIILSRTFFVSPVNKENPQEKNQIRTGFEPVSQKQELPVIGVVTTGLTNRIVCES